MEIRGFPDSSIGTCGVPGFDPWVGKIPWKRERLPTPVFGPGEFYELYSSWGCKESDTTERLSLAHWMEIGIIFAFLSFKRH